MAPRSRSQTSENSSAKNSGARLPCCSRRIVKFEKSSAAGSIPGWSERNGLRQAPISGSLTGMTASCSAERGEQPGAAAAGRAEYPRDPRLQAPRASRVAALAEHARSLTHTLPGHAPPPSRHGPGHRRDRRPGPRGGPAPRGGGRDPAAPRPRRGAPARDGRRDRRRPATTRSASTSPTSPRWTQVRALAERGAGRRPSRLDVLVNNAGIGGTLPGGGARRRAPTATSCASRSTTWPASCSPSGCCRCCGAPRRRGSSTSPRPARRRSTSTT